MTDTHLQGAPPIEMTHREVLIVIGGLMMGLLLAALDQTIVSTALPTIVGDLGGLRHLSWIVTAYLLTSTASMPLYGKVSDMIGRRRVVQAAIVIFVGGSLLSGIAQSMVQLAAARAVQGMGAGGLMAMTFTVIGDIVPPRQRGRYTGYLTGTFALASVAGPLLGGFFVDNLSWRWVFYINLPLGMLSFAVVSSVLRVPFQPRRHQVDYLGAGLLVSAVSCLLLVCVWGGREYAWKSAPIMGLGVIGLALAAAFILQERRAPEPIIPLRLFSNRIFAVAVVLSLLLGTAMFGGTVFMPLFLQVVTGASATTSGLLLLPLMAGVLVSSIAAGQIVSRTGHYKPMPILGMALATTGMVLLSQVGVATGRAYVMIAMLLLGLGMGVTMPVLTLVAQNAVSWADLGVATSAVNFFRSLGGAFGVAVFGAVLTARLDSGLAERLPPSAAGTLDSATLASSPDAIRGLEAPVQAAVVASIADAVAMVFLVAIPLLVIGFAVAWLLREIPLRETTGDAPDPAREPVAMTVPAH